MKLLVLSVMALATACGSLPQTEQAAQDEVAARLLSLDARLTAGESWDEAKAAEIASIKEALPRIKGQAVDEAVGQVLAKLPEQDGVSKTEGIAGLAGVLLSIYFRHRIGGAVSQVAKLADKVVPDNRKTG